MGLSSTKVINVPAISATVQQVAEAFKKTASKEDVYGIVTEYGIGVLEKSGEVSVKKLAQAVIDKTSKEDIFTPSGKLTEKGKQNIFEMLKELGLNTKATLGDLIKAMKKEEKNLLKAKKKEEIKAIKSPVKIPNPPDLKIPHKSMKEIFKTHKPQ